MIIHRIMMRRFTLYCLLSLCLITTAWAQPNGVTAEAIGQANLRATTDVASALRGEIRLGSRYPVLGRSQFFPWLLLGDPVTEQPIGWVFAELVTVQGDLNQTPFSTLVLDETVAPTIPATAAVQPSPTASQSLVGVAIAGSPGPTATAAFAVSGVVSGEINIRFGPGADYPRVGVGRAGDRYEITVWHAQLPWVQIRYPDSPNGLAWVALDLLDIEGDLYSLSSTSQTRFEMPTLTPTPPIIESSTLMGATPVPLSPQFAALGNQLWNLILSANFDPATSRKGALFLKDLRTGETITFNNDVAFSGMSITKIAILAELFQSLNDPPDNAEAVTIANAMVCSQNTSTNDMLSIIGGGDPFIGASRTTDFLRQLGLQRTFIVAPYVIDPDNPLIPSQPIVLPQTDADQTSAAPDPSNQLTVDEVGWLLSGIYQCAYGDDGPLREQFGDSYTQDECRQTLNVMSKNKIGALIEAGVPENIRIAHKHGWIADTHGDAGVVFTPGGDYVLVMALYNPTWLDFSESFPLMGEVSRTVYNYYNPENPAAEAVAKPVPEECNLLGNPLIEELMTGRSSE